MMSNYGKIKVGMKTLDDAVLNLGLLDSGRNGYGNKMTVIRALCERDYPTLRAISDYFYTTSGIYQRVCNYAANMYRYDWYITAELKENKEKLKTEKVLTEFSNILAYLDNSYIKKICGDIALTVVKYGCYYGYIVPSKTGLILQELPVNYCRSRYTVGTMPAVEFNMKYFDDNFKDPAYRIRVIKMFPEEFAKGYMLFKQGKLKNDFSGDSGGWYLLEPANTVKFNFNNNDIPIFINSIPAIIDLDAAQDLDRRKQMQKLLKIIVQKLPLDKNGDLIFDIDEARDIHNNAVEMLRRAVGVDVLTTFTDVESIDMSDKNTTTSKDDLEKVERTVFNTLGVSRNLFNAEGNLSLAQSILDDESSIRNLLLQFGIFFDRVTASINPSRKKYTFRFNMLETTQYNYKELSKLYREQTQLGCSKILPQIALGHSQSFIINTAYFENEVLRLNEIMIPPLMSSTMSSEDVLRRTSGDNEAGRPEKDDTEKSDKTLKNNESKA